MRLPKIHRPLIALGMATALVACTPPDKEDREARIAQQGQEAGKQPNIEGQASRLASDDQRGIVARVNGEDLTLGEFERRLNAQAPFARARYNSLERKKDFLKNLIQFEVLADEARARGYDKDPEVILEVKQAMVRKMMAAELDKRMTDVTINDEELREYYDAHIKDYVRPEQVRASQIVLPSKEAADALVKELEAAFDKDRTHKRRIFALKAREVSIDKPTADKGGDMRFFARPEEGGMVDPKLAEVAFGMEEVGKMSAPFQTPAGWHLLMVTARKQRFERPFDEVKRNIQNRLYRERRAQVERQLIDELKGKADITVNEEILATIVDPEPPKGQPSPHAHGVEGGIEAIAPPSDDQDQLPIEDDTQDEGAP